MEVKFPKKILPYFLYSKLWFRTNLLFSSCFLLQNRQVFQGQQMLLEKVFSLHHKAFNSPRNFFSSFSILESFVIEAKLPTTKSSKNNHSGNSLGVRHFEPFWVRNPCIEQSEISFQDFSIASLISK
jgi:hypothetical protein